jgi:hypothetical protein
LVADREAHQGLLLGRFVAASRDRLRELARGLGVHHLANPGGCPARRYATLIAAFLLAGAALWTASWDHAEDIVPYQPFTAKRPSRVRDTDSTT